MLAEGVEHRVGFPGLGRERASPCIWPPHGFQAQGAAGQVGSLCLGRDRRLMLAGPKGLWMPLGATPEDGRC